MVVQKSEYGDSGNGTISLVMLRFSLKVSVPERIPDCHP